MCWADRATLILGGLYTLFMFLLLGPQNPYAFSSLWWYGMAWLVGLPILVLWIILRLALGNRGSAGQMPRRSLGDGWRG